MKKFHVLTLFFLLIGISNVAAQKEIKEGKITMELNKIEADDEGTAGMLAMMKGSTITVHFNENKSLTEANMMNGMMRTTTLTDKDSNKTVIIMDMMGSKKMAEDVLPEEKETESETQDVKVTYDKSDKKKILDYDCHRADIQVSVNGQTMNMTAYVTNDIKFKADLLQGVKSTQLEGVPLLYGMEVNQGGMKFSMFFEVIEILDYVDADVFKLKTDGIEKVKMEQLLQGAGGMGF